MVELKKIEKTNLVKIRELEDQLQIFKAKNKQLQTDLTTGQDSHKKEINKLNAHLLASCGKDKNHDQTFTERLSSLEQEKRKVD